MLETLTELLLGGATGGIFGAAGALVRAWLDLKATQTRYDHEYKLRDLEARLEAAQHRHELAMADKNAERAKLEGDISLETAKAEANAKREAGELNAFIESLQEQKKTYSPWVDNFRGAMRPAITTFLTVSFTILTMVVWVAAGGLENIPKETLVGMLERNIDAWTFFAGMALGWWFGHRPTTPPRGNPV